MPLISLTKKQKNKLWTIAITLSIISSVIIIFSYFGLKPLSFVNMQIHSTTSELVYETESSATYKLSFISEPISNIGCDKLSSDTIDLNVEPLQSSSSLPIFAEGLQENTDFETTNVNFEGISAIVRPCTDLSGNINVIVNNSKAICQIKKGVISGGEQKALISCRFTGNIYPVENGQLTEALIYGLTGGTATINFPKQTYCPLGQTLCSDGVCRENCNTCPTGTILCSDGVCRENCNTCPNNQILCSDGLCKDSCEEPPNYFIIMLIVIILIGFVGGLSYIYIKTRRKK